MQHVVDTSFSDFEFRVGSFGFGAWLLGLVEVEVETWYWYPLSTIAQYTRNPTVPDITMA